MTPAIAIFRALARAMRRDAGSFFSLKVNNFFLFVLLLAYGNIVSFLPPRSAYPFLLLTGFLLLFPLSSDPLAKIPPLRYAAWPLSFPQRAGLRLASVALSPIFWVATALFVRTSLSLALMFLSVTVGIQIGSVLLRSARFNASAGGPLVFRIALPGRVGPLVAAAVRQMFSVLDTYLALAIAFGGWVYRFCYRAPDPAAYPIFALLVALALSTYAQCLFGLDSQSALTRYLLLPIGLRQVLFAKDVAFLGILFLLTLPLNPVAGLTSGLAALIIGRFSAIRLNNAQYRWRFTGGRVFWGMLQIVIGAVVGLASVRNRPIYAFITTVVYLVWNTSRLTKDTKLSPTIG